MKIDRHSVFNYLLFFFLFSIPLSEGLKQMFFYPLLITGMVIIYRDKLSLEKDTINISIVVFFIFGLLSSLFNGTQISANIDIMRNLLLFVVVRSVGLDNLNINKALYFLLSGFFITFSWAIVNKYILAEGFTHFELKSIGHVNHSSIFMLILFAIALPMFFSSGLEKKIVCALTLILCLAGILISGSRATIYTLPMVVFSYFLMTDKKLFARSTLILFGVLPLLFGGMYLLCDGYSLAKIARGISHNEARFGIFYSAIQAWQDNNMLFGIGVDNFITINLRDYLPDFILERTSHAHNTYLTILSERGMLGLLAFLAFLVSLGIKLFRQSKKNSLVQVSLLIFIVNGVVSLGNTVFHHENAIIILFFWALTLNIIDNNRFAPDELTLA